MTGEARPSEMAKMESKMSRTFPKRGSDSASRMDMRRKMIRAWILMYVCIYRRPAFRKVRLESVV